MTTSIVVDLANKAVVRSGRTGIAVREERNKIVLLGMSMVSIVDVARLAAHDCRAADLSVNVKYGTSIDGCAMATIRIQKAKRA
jgi:hypothetical protein